MILSVKDQAVERYFLLVQAYQELWGRMQEVTNTYPPCWIPYTPLAITSTDGTGGYCKDSVEEAIKVMRQACEELEEELHRELEKSK